ncbi:MAG: hypothetical protein AB1529_00125 [Candidatus Micrarchaeota archaeon]
MASVLKMAFLALVLALPLAFADAGPSPPPPKVVVHMVSGGQPEASVTSITYHCMDTTETDTSNAVEPYPLNLSCSGGTCTNEEWYYKFNPCFAFPEGYFSYEYGGNTVRTGSFNFSDSFDNYDITIDAPSGQIQGKIGSSGCPLSLILLAVAGVGAAFLRK